MRPLLITTLLVSTLSTLNAASFLERFNSLESDIENLQDDVAKIKRDKGTGTTKAVPSSLSSTEVRTLKKAIKSLTKDQADLKTKVNKIANRPVPTVTSVVKASPKAEAAAPSSEMLVSYDDEDGDFDMDEIQEQFDELSKIISDMRKFTNGNHMKLTADFRTAVDNINYTNADGSTVGNDALFTNRLYINMKYKATSKISFSSQLAFYKTFGAREGSGAFASYDDFDWITNETANDNVLRVRSAYFFYANDTFLSLNIPWTFSIGRRPSTGGHLINLRSDDSPNSPLAHSINVEFDGLSSKFDFSPIGIPGLYVKLCIGRGLTNAGAALSSQPYASNDSATDNVDLLGAIISLYNNGQYSLTTQSYVGKNIIDINQTFQAFEAVGDLYSFTANFMAEGLGEEYETFLWSEWLGNLLDQTIFFASFAMSVTDPLAGTQGMLGSQDSKTGYSYWTGIQLPTFSDKGRWGAEYNQGSKYWRSVTYGEDTLIGSKVATRGSAYEVYWTEPFANNTMSWQLRLTYIDYKYSNSNGFFGSVTGTPTEITASTTDPLGNSVTDTVTDVHFYLRYKY
jgi:hypothetical protein